MSDLVSGRSSASPPTAPAPSLSQLFAAFALISLCGFGGVLAWSRRMLVEQRRWMTGEEFNASYALCQFLPGPNVANLSVIFGGRIRGPLASFSAPGAVLRPPFIIVSAIGFIYVRFGEIAALQRMLMGVAAAAAGLVLGTCAKMALPLFRDRLGLAPAMALLTFAAIGVMRWPLHWSLALL